MGCCGIVCIPTLLFPLLVDVCPLSFVVSCPSVYVCVCVCTRVCVSCCMCAASMCCWLFCIRSVLSWCRVYVCESGFGFVGEGSWGLLVYWWTDGGSWVLAFV